MQQTKITPQEAKAELAKRELARRHLNRFIKYHDSKWQQNWHHTLICDALEKVERGEIKRLMISVPPQNGKSEIVSRNFPAWYFGKHPEDNIIASSYGADLAVDFGRDARDIVMSHEYHAVFSNVTLREDNQAAGHWVTNKGGEYTAVGIGSSTTGRGADIFLIDDPVKDLQEASSPVIQERNIGWYRAVARTRLSPKGAIILIQTRWHDSDLAGQILATEAGWTVLSLPAIAEVDEKFRKKGQPLWPARYSLAWLTEQKSALGSALWSALYQQSPINEESQVFHRKFFKYRSIEDLRERNTRCFITIDPAPGKTQNADNIGVCINWVDDQNMWNLRAFGIKFNALNLIELLFKLYTDYHFECVGIEEGLYNDVLKPFLEAEMIKRNVFFTVRELKHRQQMKELRIRGLQPRYEAGQIFHLKGYCDELETELLRFPKSAHDDVMDATAYQLQLAESPAGVRAEGQIIQNQRDRQAGQRSDSGL